MILEAILEEIRREFPQCSFPISVGDEQEELSLTLRGSELSVGTWHSPTPDAPFSYLVERCDIPLERPDAVELLLDVVRPLARRAVLPCRLKVEPTPPFQVPYNATPQQLQQALAQLPPINAGNVCVQPAPGGVFTLTFNGP